MLTAGQKMQFEQDGFLVLEDFVTKDQCLALKTRMAELLDAFDPAGISTIFSTVGEQAHARDRYFLESGDKIRFFFEAGAFDEAGRLTRDKALCINKAGHALHDLDPAFNSFSRQHKLAELASDIGFTDPRLLQSMYIFKQPDIGGEVTCHQDSTFLHTDPMSCVGFWFALEEATEENGCLLAEPGGHRRPLGSRFRRQGMTSWLEEFDEEPLPVDGLQSLPVPQGTLILLHGTLPHRSNPNLSSNSRHAYALHLIDGTCHYSSDNWLQRETPPRGFI